MLNLIKNFKKYLFFVVPGLILFIYLGCGDDSSSGKDNPGIPDQISMPLDGTLTDVQLVANQTTHLELTLQVPPEVGLLNTVELDIGATMANMDVTVAKKISNIRGLVKLVTQQAVATVLYKVGSDPATVCETGISYGPYEITSTSIDDPNPDNIALDAPTVQILNYGFIVVCMEITSSVDASFTLDQVEANVTQGDCGTPSNFIGDWVGVYQCGNSCGEPFGDSIHITIYNDGASTHYVDDGGDYYTGRICGNVYRFRRDDPGETETGTLTLINSNFAIKRSTWRLTVSPYCTGDCLDSLYRVSED